MQKTSGLLTVLLCLSTILLVVNANALAVGVKSGDWIEYQVTIIGNVPAQHNSTWARLEVMQVEGTLVSLKITSAFEDASPLVESVSIDLATGNLGDCFIIPANLNVGDSFFDRRQGNLTITNVQQKTVAEAERTLLSAATKETLYFWDQKTGILVEAHTTTSDFSMTTKATKTNMWQDQTSHLIMYAIAVTAIVILIALTFLVFRKKNAGALL